MSHDYRMTDGAAALLYSYFHNDRLKARIDGLISAAAPGSPAACANFVLKGVVYSVIWNGAKFRTVRRRGAAAKRIIQDGRTYHILEVPGDGVDEW